MNTEKILVEIASFCDPELLNTINSALIQADYPERVCFSVCYQSDDVEDYEKLKKIKNCKVVWLKEKEATGSCYARYLCQRLIDDEKYIYQIDSHMRFVKHWDTKLIEELLSLNDDKAIISFYPPTCTEEMMKLSLDDTTFDNPSNGGLMCVTEFRTPDSPFTTINCNSLIKGDEKEHKRNAFISAGNLFSFSGLHKEVLHDKNMFFYGDELFMSLKLFTYGWNVYSSGQSYIYHQYNRKNQKFPRVANAMEKEKNAFVELLNNKNDAIYLEKYDMGTKRTIDEYEKFSGIDFDNRIIYMNAETGEAENEKYIGKLSYINGRAAEREKNLSKKEIIEVIVVDLFNEYKESITNCLQNAANKESIRFIVGSISKNNPSKHDIKELNIKKFVSFNENIKYTEIVNKLTASVGDNYVAIVDSSIRFLKDWDKYLCENIKNCGNKAALTNWVWYVQDINLENVQPYFNISMKLRQFYYYLPVLEYDSTVNFSNIKNPYQTPFIFDGFIFYHSSVLKKIEFDPKLSYEEHKYLYSMRLWTSGINLYLPQVSYFIRTKEEKKLNTDNQNIDVVCALCGIRNAYSRNVEANYPYDIGNERPLWSWRDYINDNSDENKS